MFDNYTPPPGLPPYWVWHRAEERGSVGEGTGHKVCVLGGGGVEGKLGGMKNI